MWASNDRKVLRGRRVVVHLIRRVQVNKLRGDCPRDGGSVVRDGCEIIQSLQFNWIRISGQPEPQERRHEGIRNVQGARV